MARPCTICSGPSEYLASISARLRRGESVASLAREFSLSEDALSRHYRNHVLRDQGAGGGTSNRAIDLLHKIIGQTGEIASTAASQGDLRASTEALSKQLNALESLLELESQQKAESRKLEKSETMTMGDFDQLIAEAEKHYDTCPTCGARTIYKAFKSESSKSNSEPAQQLHIIN